MIEELYNYLMGLVAPEKCLIYKDACDLLVEVDPDKYGNLLLNFMDAPERDGTSAALQQFDGFIVESLCNEIQRFAVYITEDFILVDYIEELRALLSTLINVEFYQDPEEISLILDSTPNASEAIGEIIRSVDKPSIRQDRIMEIIEEVSPSLLKRLSEVLKESMILPSLESEEVVTVPPERIKKWLEEYPSPIIVKMFNDGIKLGSSYDNYIDYLYHYIQEEKDVNMVARILILAAVATNIPNDRIKPLVLESIGSIIIDPMLSLRVSRTVNNFVLVEA